MQPTVDRRRRAAPEEERQPDTMESEYSKACRQIQETFAAGDTEPVTETSTHQKPFTGDIIAFSAYEVSLRTRSTSRMGSLATAFVGANSIGKRTQSMHFSRISFLIYYLIEYTDVYMCLYKRKNQPHLLK